MRIYKANEVIRSQVLPRVLFRDTFMCLGGEHFICKYVLQQPSLQRGCFSPLSGIFSLDSFFEDSKPCTEELLNMVFRVEYGAKLPERLHPVLQGDSRRDFLIPKWR